MKLLILLLLPFALCDVSTECPPLFNLCIPAEECGEHIPAEELPFLLPCSDGVCCPHDITTPLPTRKVEAMSPEEDCREMPSCEGSSTKYRNIDGSCNNIINPLIGTMGSTYLRLLPAQYEDGVSAVRSTGDDGNPLPLVRKLSVDLSPDENKPNKDITLMVMQWGQFISHDLSKTPVIKDENGEKRECCTDGKLPVQVDECIPVVIPPDDPFYSQFDVTCMELLRSVGADNLNCSNTIREQPNVLSHFLDGSVVYGSSDEEADNLREFQNGRLKISVVHNREFLPFNDECDIDPPEDAACFLAGDTRANVLSGLTLLHMFFMREHNRIAAYLHRLNSGWDDEKLYQESKRIVTAQIQVITYKEYLPIVLGKEYMKKYSLLTKQKGYSYEYSPEIDATISNEHTTAGFRFGHSQIQGKIKTYGRDGKKGSFQLKDHFHPHMLFEDRAEELISRGLYKQSPQGVDPYFVKDVTQHLFPSNEDYGRDLEAINLKRGREHGLPGYNAYRELCGFPKATAFQDFSDTMTPESISKLEASYKHVDDVDLFIAGLLENKAEGSILGPMFQCIVGDQLFRTKWGDSFFYDLGGRPHSFTPGQLKEIRKITMARILCDNGHNLEKMQRNVFKKCSPENNIAHCYGCSGRMSIPKMNLDQWKEK